MAVVPSAKCSHLFVILLDLQDLFLELNHTLRQTVVEHLSQDRAVDLRSSRSTPFFSTVHLHITEKILVGQLHCFAIITGMFLELVEETGRLQSGLASLLVEIQRTPL